MSVQAVSRIAALLALDADALRSFLPKEDDGGVDESEESRVYFVHHYRHQITEEEKAMLEGGDMIEIFEYIRAHLPKPVNGDQSTPKGGG